jgi:hypothetical protein
MSDDGSRTRKINTTTFWRIIFPVVMLLFLLFILFVVYTMPDWALDCSPNLMSVRRLASSMS